MAKAAFSDSSSPPPRRKKITKRTKSPVATTSSTSLDSKQKATTRQPAKDTALPVYPSTFKVIAGSYEKLLYGLEGTFTSNNSAASSSLKLGLKPIFIFPAHVSSIKAVAASPEGGKWLATGSTDEIIKVWDLRRRKEIGGLMHHEGSITHLQFPSRSHMISASEDGTLCLFRARDWSVLRSLKGHKGRVNCVAVHPSGKVALSVGNDRTLRMWDLMRGKGAASTKLGKEGELVRWSTTGSIFVVQARSTLDIYSTDMTLLHVITHPSRVHDVKFWKQKDDGSDLLFVAAEDKMVAIYQMGPAEEPPRVVAKLAGHTNRVKAVDLMEVGLPASPNASNQPRLLASTASSDGHVHVYDLSCLPEHFDVQSDKMTIEPSVTYDTKGSRLTCITMADGEVVQSSSSLAVKRKRNGAVEDDDGEVDADDWEPQETDDGGNYSASEEEEHSDED